MILGVLPALAARPDRARRPNRSREPDRPRHLGLWHGFTVTLAAERGDARRFGRPCSPRGRDCGGSHGPARCTTERLYTSTLAGLDALSRRVAPALQSASLRSYVLTVIVTAVALVTTRWRSARALPPPRRWTPIQFHEGGACRAHRRGALSAAFARSSMAAVLSLGTVGYGVAVMYALLGAPDLAMTQFAVETLTVVIFVLVFSGCAGSAICRRGW